MLPLGHFALFFISVEMEWFFKSSFRNINRVAKSLVQDEAQDLVWPVLRPNFRWQKLPLAGKELIKHVAPIMQLPKCVIKKKSNIQVRSPNVVYGKCSKISNTLKLRTPKIIVENNF